MQLLFFILNLPHATCSCSLFNCVFLQGDHYLTANWYQEQIQDLRGDIILKRGCMQCRAEIIPHTKSSSLNKSTFHQTEEKWVYQKSHLKLWNTMQLVMTKLPYKSSEYHGTNWVQFYIIKCLHSSTKTAYFLFFKVRMHMYVLRKSHFMKRFLPFFSLDFLSKIAHCLNCEEGNFCTILKSLERYMYRIKFLYISWY